MLKQGVYDAPMVKRYTLIAVLVAMAFPLVSQSATSCPALSRTLSRGTSGTDVTALQQFLISRNLLAVDSATGYFGPKTEQAIQAFQKSQNLATGGTAVTTGYGLVGKKTRDSIATLCISSPQSITSIKEHVVPKLRNPQCTAVALPIGKACSGKWKEMKDTKGCTASWKCAE